MSQLRAGFLSLLVLSGAAPFCAGQGIAKAGALAGMAAVAGRAAQSAGAAAGKALERTSGALGENPAPAGRQSARKNRRAIAGRSRPANSSQTPGLAAPTPEAFAGIAAGMEEEELRARLGRASSRIVTAEEGRLIEVWRYRVNGRELGSVRLVDGRVAEVRAARK